MIEPLPLDAVRTIVERRRRSRDRVRAVAAPALSVGAVGLAGILVVALQVGPGAPAPLTPAAPGPSSLTAAPPATRPDDPAGLDPAFRDPALLTGLATAIGGRAAPEVDRLLSDAEQLAQVWGLTLDPVAKAVVLKADLAGYAVDPLDPRNADELAGLFAQEGYTATDAVAIADAWGTDARAAEVMGGLLLKVGVVPS